MMKYSSFKFSIQNFRVFDKAHTFDLKPIQFLTGPNNTGKSSLVKSMLLLKQNLHKGELPISMKFDSHHHSLNSFNDVLAIEDNPLTYSLPINSAFFGEGEIKLLYFGDDKEIGEKGNNLTARLHSLSIEFENKKFIQFSVYNNGFHSIHLDLIFFIEKMKAKINKIVEMNKFYSLERIMAYDKSSFLGGNDPETFEFDENLERLKKTEEYILFRSYFYDHKVDNTEVLLPFKVGDSNEIELFEISTGSGINLSEELSEKSKLIEFEILDQVNEIIASNRISANDLEGTLSRNPYSFLDDNKSLSDLINEFFKQFLNFMSLKIKDQLEVKYNDQFNVDYTGLLKILKDTVIARDINTSLLKTATRIQNIINIPSNKYEGRRFINIKHDKTFLGAVAKAYYLAEQGMVRGEDYAGKYFNEEFIAKWLVKFDLGQSLKIRAYEDEILSILIKSDNTETNISNMGTGVSQIISIILSPLLLFDDSIGWEAIGKKDPKKFTLYLEEPESNLHPNWQSLITELIIDINKTFGVNFIIETHSEYMIRKLQNMVAQDKSTNEMCGVLYFRSNLEYNRDKSKDKTRCFEIGINRDGTLTKEFGTGFVDEALNLEFDLIKIRNFQQN